MTQVKNAAFGWRHPQRLLFNLPSCANERYTLLLSARAWLQPL